jgi:hypothetical protein
MYCLKHVAFGILTPYSATHISFDHDNKVWEGAICKKNELDYYWKDTEEYGDNPKYNIKYTCDNCQYRIYTGWDTT